ncbi:MAG: DUF1697 domain-containing protein [Myxococcales bacterium]|nr:DUF1697 domain-containing protein [Myxococcales bacterium]
MTSFVALLRGINVGGKRMLPMKDLVALFTKAGAMNVQTYLQSGNVVFDAKTAPAIVERVRSAIETKFGFDVPMVVRSGDALDGVVASNPFDDVEHAHVVFLADAPMPAQVKALDPNRSPGDRFVVRGGDVFLHLPNGVARTKLSNAWFDSQLKTVSTVRNWKTVLALARL